MFLNENAHILREYIYTLQNFDLEMRYYSSYDHIGAILTDTVLQAGLNYRTVVLPRVMRVIELFPYANTVTQFYEVLFTYGEHYVLNWKHFEKPKRLINLTSLLHDSQIETHINLHDWLVSSMNREKLRSISGIGPKTIDYLGKLVNLPTVPIDRHIKSFIAGAGISWNSYEDIQIIVKDTAHMIGISESSLDSAIWNYMSSTNKDKVNMEKVPSE
ncbi:MAG TPA: hypothetical protein DCW42_04195 [Bacteroidetes bacterium]|nr:hypothetical protein [Bacteroidota bacterium]